MPTLNQVIQDLRTTALSHKQIKEFYFGSVDDFLAVKGRQYGCCVVDIQPGSIANKQTTFSFEVFFLDLVNLSEDTKQNRNDVWSDQVQVCEDFIAMLTDNRVFRSWTFTSSTLNFWDDYKGDYLAGVSVLINIAVPFEANRCAVPRN